MRCFSPESTPGVSTSVTSSSSWLGQAAASNLDRKPLPYCDSPCAHARTHCIRFPRSSQAKLSDSLESSLEHEKVGNIILLPAANSGMQHQPEWHLSTGKQSIPTTIDTYYSPGSQHSIFALTMNN